MKPIIEFPFACYSFFPASSLATPAKRLGAISSRVFSLLLGMFALVLTPALSFADQFVLFDVTFTFTKEDADNSKPSKSHYYVKGDKLNPARPRDWTAPVDYRNGTVHIRTEVLEKPAGAHPPPGPSATSRIAARGTATGVPARISIAKRAFMKRTCR